MSCDWNETGSGGNTLPGSVPSKETQQINPQTVGGDILEMYGFHNSGSNFMHKFILSTSNIVHSTVQLRLSQLESTS